MSPSCGTSHNARCWLCTDTCGLICATVTICLILFSQWIVSKQIALTLSIPAVHEIAFNSIASLAMVSHLRAMLSDPGAVPKNAEPLVGDTQRLKEAMSQNASHRKRAKGWCHRCNAYKPPRAHHCNVTGRCIVKLDHYCPWTNNAIGVRNHKFFLLFILYTFLMCVYALAVVVHAGLAANKKSDVRFDQPQKKDLLNKEDGDDAEDTFGPGAMAVATCGVLFGLFTSCMLCDQWTVLSTNVAKIDRLKGESLSVSNEVNEVFGGRSRGFQVHWLFPLAVRFPKSVHDDVMGFRLPDRQQQQEQEDDGDIEMGRPTLEKKNTFDADEETKIDDGGSSSQNEKKPLLSSAVDGLADSGAKGSLTNRAR